jgi:hypothetical protein
MRPNDFSAEVKKQIRERDKYICRKCGENLKKLSKFISADLNGECHHIIACVDGGLGTVENGVLLCGNCHYYITKFSFLTWELFMDKRLIMPHVLAHKIRISEYFVNKRIREISFSLPYKYEAIYIGYGKMKPTKKFKDLSEEDCRLYKFMVREPAA